MAPVPLPKSTPLAVKVVAPVPPTLTARVSVALSAEVPLPRSSLPDDKVVEPVPP